MAALSLPFFKLSPGGNPTILIWDNGLFTGRSSFDRAAIANALMDPDHLGAEQVGFLDTSRDPPHLEMMGGEFCVNATRSAALVFAQLGLLPVADGKNGVHEGSITTSGVKEPVLVRVSALPGLPEAMAREAAVAVPLSGETLVTACADGEALVRLPGIAHILLDMAEHPLPDSPLDAAAAKRTAHGLENEDASGVIWHCREGASRETHSIYPVVHVAATGSTVMETACGSGSLALALLLSSQGGGHAFTLRQPSGHYITVTIPDADNIAPARHSWISGIARLTAQGTAHVLIPSEGNAD